MALFRILLYRFGGMTDWFIKYYVRLFIIILWILFIYWMSWIISRESQCVSPPTLFLRLINGWLTWKDGVHFIDETNRGHTLFCWSLRQPKAIPDQFQILLPSVSPEYGFAICELLLNKCCNYFVAVFWMLSVCFLLLFYFSWLLNIFHCLEIY